MIKLHWKIVWQFLLKLFYIPATLLQGIYLKKNENICQKIILYKCSQQFYLYYQLKSVILKDIFIFIHLHTNTYSNLWVLKTKRHSTGSVFTGEIFQKVHLYFILFLQDCLPNMFLRILDPQQQQQIFKYSLVKSPWEYKNLKKKKFSFYLKVFRFISLTTILMYKFIWQ